MRHEWLQTWRSCEKIGSSLNGIEQSPVFATKSVHALSTMVGVHDCGYALNGWHGMVGRLTVTWAQSYPVLGSRSAATASGVRQRSGPARIPSATSRCSPELIFYNPMRILIGSIAFVDDDDEPGITSPDYVVLKGKPGVVDSRWFYYWLRSPLGRTMHPVPRSRRRAGTHAVQPACRRRDRTSRLRHAGKGIAGARADQADAAAIAETDRGA